MLKHNLPLAVVGRRLRVLIAEALTPCPSPASGRGGDHILKYSLSRFSGEGGPQGRVRVKSSRIFVSGEHFSAYLTA